MIFKRKKRKEERALEADIANLRAETEAIEQERPKVDNLVKQLHEHLAENNIGRRLYLQIVENQR